MNLPDAPPTDEEVNMLFARSHPIERITLFNEYLEIVQTEYLHWTDFQEKFKNAKLTPTDLRLLWGYTNLSRQLNSRIIPFLTLNLRYVQTPQLEKTLHVIDMQIGDKIELEEKVPEAGLRKKYLVNSLMEEAIASSQIEGAATTRAVAKKMLQENRKPRTKDERMIVNNYLAMKFIKDQLQKSRRLNIDFIKELHKVVTHHTLEKTEYEGQFRDNNDINVYYISEEKHGEIVKQLIHTPPDYKKIKDFMEEFCNFANNEQRGYYLHPIVKAIALHYMIGYLHPFYDGNGRTARALFYWYALSQGYDYLEYIALSTAIKSAYKQYPMAYLYAESDHNDITYFVKFNMEMLNTAINSFKAYINRKKIENRKILDTIHRDRRLNLRQADIINNLSKSERRITIEEMQERYNITYETARTDLLELVEIGFMHKLPIGKRFFFMLDKEEVLRSMHDLTENGQK